MRKFKCGRSSMRWEWLHLTMQWRAAGHPISSQKCIALTLRGTRTNKRKSKRTPVKHIWVSTACGKKKTKITLSKDPIAYLFIRWGFPRTAHTSCMYEFSLPQKGDLWKKTSEWKIRSGRRNKNTDVNSTYTPTSSFFRCFALMH